MITWKNNNTLRRSRKEIWRLEERLIPATVDRLNSEMKRRSELKILLNTPLKDLDKKYLNLIDDEDLELYWNTTLKDIIINSLKSKRGVYFYSEANEDLEGFAYYTTSLDGIHVRNIAIFSFDLQHPGFVLAGDMIRLLRELKTKYKTVSFECKETQPLVDAYKKVTEELGGHYELDDGTWYFEIPGDIETKLREKFNRN